MEYNEVIKLPLKVKISKFKEMNLRKELIERTSFLPEKAGIGERIYCIDNNITNIITCYCGNPVKYLKYSMGYSKRCSIKCVHNDPDVIKKRKNTCLEKYGVDSYTKTKENLDKRRTTCLKRYGVDNPMKLDTIKNIRKKNIHRKIWC